MSYNKNIAYLSYECEGYNYEPWEDKEEDNIKIWHDIKTPGGQTIHGPWSPYVTPTLEQFSEFVTEYHKIVELGRPKAMLDELMQRSRWPDWMKDARVRLPGKDMPGNEYVGADEDKEAEKM